MPSNRIKESGGFGILWKYERAARAKDGENIGRGAVGERRIDEVAVLRREAIGMALRYDVGVPAPIGLHHALGNARSAAGELDRRRRIERKVGPRERRFTLLRAAKHGVVCRPVEHVSGDAVTVDPRCHRFVEQHGARANVFDDALQFRVAIARIERHPRLARGDHRQNCSQMFDRVPAADADAGLRSRVVRLQIGRDAHDLRGQLGKRHLPVRRDDGDLIRGARSGAKEEFDRLHQARPRIVTTVAASSTPKKPPPFSAAAKRAPETCRAPASPRNCITSS